MIDISTHRKSDDSPTSSDIEDGSTTSYSNLWKPSRQEWLAMITMAVCSLVVALDASILVTVLPTLSHDLKAPTTTIFWAGTSYLLANAVLQPFVAALSDIFGRKELIIPSLILFTVGSIVCAVAHDFTTFIIGRVLQGVGGGGIITLSQIVFADIVPLRQRPKYFAIILSAYAFGTVIGPLLGGVFVQKSTWRWCFYINFPICGIGLMMTFFFVNHKTQAVSFRDQLSQVDWIGGFLFTSSLTSFLIALSWGGVQYTWSSWHTLVPLLLGACGISLAILWERAFARNPFLTEALFSSVSLIAAYTTALLQGLVLFLALYFVAFYFTVVRLHSPIRTGIDLLPATIAFTPAGILAAAIITRTGHYRWSLYTGWTLSTIGSGLIILLEQKTPTAVWATAICILGLGLGILLCGINFTTQALIDTPNAARAAGMYAFMRSLGFCIAVAIGGTIFTNQTADKLQDLGLDRSLARNAEPFLARILDGQIDRDSTQATWVFEAFVHGFKGIWVTMTAICGVGLLLSLAIGSRNGEGRSRSSSSSSSSSSGTEKWLSRRTWFASNVGGEV